MLASLLEMGKGQTVEEWGAKLAVEMTASTTPDEFLFLGLASVCINLRLGDGEACTFCSIQQAGWELFSTGTCVRYLGSSEEAGARLRLLVCLRQGEVHGSGASQGQKTAI